MLGATETDTEAETWGVSVGQGVSVTTSIGGTGRTPLGCPDPGSLLVPATQSAVICHCIGRKLKHLVYSVPTLATCRVVWLLGHPGAALGTSCS